MTPKKLPFDQFLKTFEFVPRIAVNLLIEQSMEVSQTSKEVLLTRRKRPPFAGSWHMPGSFLLKGEPLMDCVHRVAKEETGVDVTDIELAGVFDDLTGDPRGHVVDVVYRCRIGKGLALRSRARPLVPVGDTAEIRFFKKLPKSIGFNHRETLGRVL